MDRRSPNDYEAKFAEFTGMCRAAKDDGVEYVLVACPSVLGDNYQEITESLNRMADAGLKLAIARRNP